MTDHSRAIESIIRAAAEFEDPRRAIEVILSDAHLDPKSERCARLLTMINLEGGIDQRDSEIRAGIEAVLRDPPEDVDFFVVFLCRAASYATFYQKDDDAKRLLELAGTLVSSHSRTEVKCQYLLARLKRAGYTHHHDEVIRLSGEALGLLKQGSNMWKEVKQFRIDSFRFLLECGKAMAELAEIEACPPQRHEDLYLKASLLNNEGKLWEAKAYVESLLPTIGEWAKGYLKLHSDIILWFHTFTLATLGLTDLARSVIHQHKEVLQSEWTSHLLESMLALADRDLAKARRIISEMEDNPFASSVFINTRKLFIAAWIELSSGNLKAAETVVNQIPRLPCFAYLHGRLAFLKGNQTEAMGIFRSYTDKAGVQALAARLMLAHEISGVDASRILLGCLSPTPAPAGSLERETKPRREDGPATAPQGYSPSPAPASPQVEAPTMPHAMRLQSRLDALLSEQAKAPKVWVSCLDPVPASGDAGGHGGRVKEGTESNPILARFVGTSTVSRMIRSEIIKLAPLDATVLITGETGTGKEVVARLLHELSPRGAKPFIPVNCGGISETLMESELFGHGKGAFTGADKGRKGIFEAAGEGTVLLDEIHAMPPRLQAALLRVLENREVKPVGSNQVRRIKARIIAATNVNLERAAKEEEFRFDLLFRLNQFELRLPPLRERSDDVAALILHFLSDYYEMSDMNIAPALLEEARRWQWPGNVRELRNMVERMALRAGGVKRLGVELFHACVTRHGSTSETGMERGKRMGEGNSIDRHVGSHHRAPAMISPRHTHSRRKELKRFFAEHHSLTRAEIVKHLNCSPGTATEDLKALVAEGTIRRVETSGHLRTSYFVWTGNLS